MKMFIGRVEILVIEDRKIDARPIADYSENPL